MLWRGAAQSAAEHYFYGFRLVIPGGDRPGQKIQVDAVGEAVTVEIPRRKVGSLLLYEPGKFPDVAVVCLPASRS